MEFGGGSKYNTGDHQRTLAFGGADHGVRWRFGDWRWSETSSELSLLGVVGAICYCAEDRQSTPVLDFGWQPPDLTEHAEPLPAPLNGNAHGDAHDPQRATPLPKQHRAVVAARAPESGDGDADETDETGLQDEKEEDEHHDEED